MKVGDLIRYKAFPETGHGVVLDIDNEMVLIYFTNSYPHYIWDFRHHLEVASCK